MALGIPCISTDCRPGGTREIIEDGVDGYIIPLGDKEMLAETMLKVIREPEQSLLMADRTSSKMQKYKPENIYSRWEDFFRDLVR